MCTIASQLANWNDSTNARSHSKNIVKKFTHSFQWMVVAVAAAAMTTMLCGNPFSVDFFYYYFHFSISFTTATAAIALLMCASACEHVYTSVSVYGPQNNKPANEEQRDKRKTRENIE